MRVLILTGAAAAASLLALAGCEQAARETERQAERAAETRAESARAEALRAEAERRREKRDETLKEKAIEWPVDMAKADSEANAGAPAEDR